MKKTITCATTSLLLIGILTLQTLAINFKSEENIDNLVFPFMLTAAICRTVFLSIAKLLSQSAVLRHFQETEIPLHMQVLFAENGRTESI